LKKYIQAHVSELSDRGSDQSRDRYALGAGVALLNIDDEIRRREHAQQPIEPSSVGAMREAAAKAVLPEYDRLAKEAEYEEQRHVPGLSSSRTAV
jgi:hypothetical protein